MVSILFRWAKCLQDSGALVSHSFDHSVFLNQPGLSYPAKKQCEILLRDRDAVVAPNQKLDGICYNLQCKTPHRSGFYFAGPALEGTQCGNGRVMGNFRFRPIFHLKTRFSIVTEVIALRKRRQNQLKSHLAVGALGNRAVAVQVV